MSIATGRLQYRRKFQFPITRLGNRMLLSYSFDGLYLAVVIGETLSLRSTTNGDLLVKNTRRNHSILCMTWSPSGYQILCGYDDGWITTLTYDTMASVRAYEYPFIEHITK